MFKMFHWNSFIVLSFGVSQLSSYWISHFGWLNLPQVAPRSCISKALLLLRAMTHTWDCFFTLCWESKQKWKTKNKAGGRDLIIKDLFFRLGSGVQSEPRYAFNETGNTFLPTSFPSFLPRLLSSLQGSSLRSFEGEGGNFTLERNGDVWKPVSRGRRGVFYERWPYSLTCCAL